MAVFNEAYTINELSKKNDPFKDINEFFEFNSVCIDHIFNEQNFSYSLTEATGSGIGAKLKELVHKAVEFVKKIWNWIKEKMHQVKEKIRNKFSKKKNNDVPVAPNTTHHSAPNGLPAPNSSEKRANASEKMKGTTISGNGDAIRTGSGRLGISGPSEKRVSASEKMKGSKLSSGDTIQADGKKKLELDEPVDLDEILKLMEKNNVTPKLNIFAWPHCEIEICGKYLAYLDRMKDGENPNIDDFMSKHDYKIDGWDDRTYVYMIQCMCSLIRKRYFANTISDKKGYYTSNVVDPEDAKFYDKVFEYVEGGLNQSIKIISKKDRKDEMTNEYYQHCIRKLKLISQAYNDIAKYQAENLQTYYKLIELMPVYADKVRAERRKG